MEETNVLAENLNTAEAVALETTEGTATENQNAEQVDWKSKAEKAEEVANNYKVRAEKAERLAKQGQTTSQPQAPKTEFSTLDAVALVKANVPEEDIKEVQEYAKFKNISISEALKSSVVKSLLEEKSETRKTANASNVSNVKRGAVKASGETLLAKAQKGEFPDNEEDIATLIRATRGMK